MKLLQTVVVKQILTEKSKKEIGYHFLQQKQQLQKESEQLRFELKKLERNKRHAQDNLITHVEKEVQMRQEKIKLLDFQLEQLHMLPLGSELQESEHQAIVEVKEGDSWAHISKGKTIVVKDGIVKEIR